MPIIENPTTIEDYQNNVKEYQNMTKTLEKEKETLTSQVQTLQNEKTQVEEDLQKSRELVSEYAFKIVTDYRPPSNNGKSGEGNEPPVTIDDILKDL